MAARGGGGKPRNTGIPPGAYTIALTGSTGSGSSALSHSVNLMLTVS
jgi:adenylylsulfate kinase-like enzyme